MKKLDFFSCKLLQLTLDPEMELDPFSELDRDPDSQINPKWWLRIRLGFNAHPQNTDFLFSFHVPVSFCVLYFSLLFTEKQ